MPMTYSRKSASMPMPGKPKTDTTSVVAPKDRVTKPQVPNIPSHVAREEMTNPKPPVPKMTLETPGHMPAPMKIDRSTKAPPPRMCDLMPGSYPPNNKPDRIATYDNQGKPPYALGGADPGDPDA